MAFVHRRDRASFRCHFPVALVHNDAANRLLCLRTVKPVLNEDLQYETVYVKQCDNLLWTVICVSNYGLIHSFSRL